MSHELRTVVRHFSPEDRDAILQVLAASFQGFGPVDQVVGDNDKAPVRRRRMYELALKEGMKQKVIVAERDGRIEGDLRRLARLHPERPRRSRRRAHRRPTIAGSHPGLPHGRQGTPENATSPSARAWRAARGAGPGCRGLLMSECARHCDEAGLEGYLETVRWADPSKRAKERLYERHGFAVAEVVPMTDDWSMVTMKRPGPRRQAAEPADRAPATRPIAARGSTVRPVRPADASGLERRRPAITLPAGPARCRRG